MKEYTLQFEESLGRDEIFSSRSGIRVPQLLTTHDNEIAENRKFDYNVLVPDNNKEGSRVESAIILFHGLNERSWEKYRPWAEYLVKNTGRAVIMFPIAMHINRSPGEWANPREMQRYLGRDLTQKIGNENLSFANYALSTRIKADPFRFYLSGRETIYNITQLMSEIRDGKSTLFSQGCTVDIFAYSIGALLSQILMMSNPGGFFKESRLFMFCGGSFFGDMNGNSKLIMDKQSFELLNTYYREVFIEDARKGLGAGDSIERAFISHIDKQFFSNERKNFYMRAKGRIKAVSLRKDRVIPSFSIKKVLEGVVRLSHKEYDFPFDYCHEAPFPSLFRSQGWSDDVRYWFEKVFSEASEFLADRRSAAEKCY
ncbi:MAG: DUF6051 family protein [Bacteroidales bacterium]|nr:DUF6051 family protein [Bacteroidales bacterium]MDZ4058866.1 DUF6051 family protein [Bacteroidales bacterium]